MRKRQTEAGTVDREDKSRVTGENQRTRWEGRESATKRGEAEERGEGKQREEVRQHQGKEYSIDQQPWANEWKLLSLAHGPPSHSLLDYTTIVTGSSTLSSALHCSSFQSQRSHISLPVVHFTCQPNMTSARAAERPELWDRAPRPPLIWFEQDSEPETWIGAPRK